MAIIREIEDDERWTIRNIIGPQLQHDSMMEIEVDGEKCNISYCTINTNPDDDPLTYYDNVIFITGFGSGWRGMARLGYHSAIQDEFRRVTMVSLPGYGNSDDLPAQTIRRLSVSNNFKTEAELLHQWATKTFPGRRLHFVTHSMSAAIVTTMAYMFPETVASLILIAPAGFEKRGKIELAIKFLTNGIRHYFAFRGDQTWYELENFLPKERGPFSTLRRIKQRLSEWRRLCMKVSLGHLKRVVTNGALVSCILGEKDYVCPKPPYCFGITRYYSLPLWHNMTMYGSEKTAEVINEFLINL